MKPHTAIIIVIIVWITCAVLNTTPFYGLGKFYYANYHGNCTPKWTGQLGYVIYTLIIVTVLIGVIIITSIWTCCSMRNYFTRREERNIVRQEDNVYVSKKQQVVGIFGMLLLMTAICFVPVLIVAALATGLEMPPQVYAALVVCALFITVSNPLVQSFFRQDVKLTIAHMIKPHTGTVTHTTNTQV